MAVARKWLGSRYNKPGFDLFDYNIYAICGDGDMMEGVGSEAASLAGHLALDDLCWIYDNNHITIDGKTRITFTEDVAARFLAYHWNVLRVGDANDLESIEEALAVFRKTKDRPTLIILDSHIGYGSPHKVDTSAAHGEPLGEDEVKLVKRAYHWPENAKFLVPDGVMEHFAEGIGQRGGKARGDWEAMFAKYRERFADRATEIDQMQRRELPAGWDRNLPSFPPDPKGIAGRDASSRPEYFLVSRRLSRSRIVKPDVAQIQRCRAIRTRHARRPQYSFRHPRARDGRDRQRSVALEATGLWIDLLHLQRLRPAGHSALGAHGIADNFRFHPRRHGRWRRWTDSSAS
jgi:transketolase